VGDNASSNDSELTNNLNNHPDINLRPHHRLRCAGHIINLVVKATIYGKGVSRWEEELANAPLKQQFKLYRKLGVVGKLHNFVNAVCASHKRRELFDSIQKQANEEQSIYVYSTLNLRQDGGIRWHSVYLMLLRCLELREAIKLFIRKLRNDEQLEQDDLNYGPLTDAITDDEWDEVAELVDFLEVPYEMTRRLEGNNSNPGGYGSLWQTLTNLQILWVVYSEASERLHSSKFFQTATLLGLEKLNTYFDKLIMEPDVSYYAVATSLHPRLRLIWFKTHWRHFPKWYQKAEASINHVFKYYTDAEVEIDELTQPPSRRKLPGGDYNNNMDLYTKTMAVDLHLMTNAKRKKQKRVTQLEEYFDDLLTEYTNGSERELQLLDDPWAWWLQVGRNRYPIVFKMATDFLTIPSTSCDCERAFSSAGRTITCDRNSLSPVTIEAIQLQKNWLQRDVVNSSLNELEKHVRSLTKKTTLSVGNSQASAESGQSEASYAS
jgi:hypothetical protein